MILFIPLYTEIVMEALRSSRARKAAYVGSKCALSLAVFPLPGAWYLKRSALIGLFR
jgi:hypothetical protein